jgi:hypothetical protein
MRVPLEVATLTTGAALTYGGISQFSQIFPLSGEGWDTIRLGFNVTTAGTGGTPITTPQGIFGAIKNVEFKTSKGELICSTPGTGLMLYNYMINRSEPFYEPIAAGAATFRVICDIPCAPGLFMINRLEDLYLDSGAYTNLELQVTMGNTIADLYSTVGSQTAGSFTLDISLLRTKAAIDDANRKSHPVYVPYIRHYPIVNPNTGATSIILESAQDLYLSGFIGYGLTGNASLVPYYNQGTQAWVIKNVNFRDNVTRWVNNAPESHFGAEARKLFQMANQAISSVFSPVGLYPHLFIRDWSVREGYWTGNKSEIRMEWTFDTGSNPSFDFLAMGFRKIRKS